MKGVILQHQLRMITFKKQVLNRCIPFHIVIKWPFSYTIAFLSLAIFSTLEPSFRIIQHYSIQRMIKMIILLADRFSLLVELRLVCHLLAFVWCWFNCQASIISLSMYLQKLPNVPFHGSYMRLSYGNHPCFSSNLDSICPFFNQEIETMSRIIGFHCKWSNGPI